MDAVWLIKAAIMGVVEGLTEFLPISSTGHLILAGSLLGFHDDKAKVFDIAIQTGAIFAVIGVYGRKVWGTLVALPTQREARRFAVNVFIGFLPAVVLGLLFGKAIQAHLFTPTVVASTFILGGFIILWAEARHRPRTEHDHPADLARIHHVENTGIAFGLFANSTSAVIALTMGAVATMLAFFTRSARRHPILPVALGLVIGGSVAGSSAKREASSCVRCARRGSSTS